MQAARLQAGFLQAMLGLKALHELAGGWRAGAPACESFLAQGYQLLSDCHLLTMQHSAWPRACIASLERFASEQAAGGHMQWLDPQQAAGGHMHWLDFWQAPGGHKRWLDLQWAVGEHMPWLDSQQAAGGYKRLLDVQQAAGGHRRWLDQCADLSP